MRMNEYIANLHVSLPGCILHCKLCVTYGKLHRPVKLAEKKKQETNEKRENYDGIGERKC